MVRRKRKTRWMEKTGYVFVRTSDGRARYEHYLVMEQMLGRPVRWRGKEVVRHKNGIKSDNRPENLELVPKERKAGPKGSNWKGSGAKPYRQKMKNGYIRVWTPGGVRRYEHRVVMEGMLGRPLLSKEVVHHKNHDRADNRPENLELASSNSEHFKRHHPPRRRLVPPPPKELRRMYAAGSTLTVAAKMGVSYSTVIKWLLEAGIPVKTMRQARIGYVARTRCLRLRVPTSTPTR